MCSVPCDEEGDGPPDEPEHYEQYDEPQHGRHRCNECQVSDDYKSRFTGTTESRERRLKR